MGWCSFAMQILFEKWKSLIKKRSEKYFKLVIFVFVSIHLAQNLKESILLLLSRCISMSIPFSFHFHPKSNPDDGIVDLTIADCLAELWFLLPDRNYWQLSVVSGQ